MGASHHGQSNGTYFWSHEREIHEFREKYKITESTKRAENRYVGAPGHGNSDSTHVWSLRRGAVDFSKNLHAIGTYLSNMK